MSRQVVDGKCPGCGKEVSVNVDIPEPKETVKLVVQEDTTRVTKLTDDLTESQRTVDGLHEELQRWQNGENHLQAQGMLTMLQTCPTCKPTWEAAVRAVRDQSVAGLTVDQVKEIARKHKLWPPPPIEIVPPRSRKV